MVIRLSSSVCCSRCMRRKKWEGEDELKEKRSCMTMNVDEMRLKNTLSHEVHVTRHHKKDEDYALSVHAHRLCNLRVSVFVSLYLLLMWFVSCLSLVIVLLFILYSYSFRGQFSVVGGKLFTKLLQFFHFLETSHELHVVPNFDAITAHEKVVDLVVEVLQLERSEVLPAEIQ